jgi:hypothetical protein
MRFKTLLWAYALMGSFLFLAWTVNEMRTFSREMHLNIESRCNFLLDMRDDLIRSQRAKDRQNLNADGSRKE